MNPTQKILLVAATLCSANWGLAQDQPRPPQPPQPPEANKERPMQNERLQNMKRQAEEKAKQAEAAGDAPKAEHIRQEVREAMKKAQEMSKPQPTAEPKRPAIKEGPPPQHDRPDTPMPPEEIVRKLRCLKGATEQLMAGGFPDAAAQLRPLAERMERQLHSQTQAQAHGQPQGADLPPPVAAELQNLRREVTELREMTRRLQGQREGQREAPPREGQREGPPREGGDRK